MSIAGGVSKAIGRGRAAGCGAIQIFTKNASQWEAPPLTDGEVRRFHAAREETGIATVAAHDSYLINLAAPEKDLRERSIRTLAEELARADRLGIPFLVVHPGAHRGEGPRKGIARVASALDRIHRAAAGARTRILLETTAGQGTLLGSTFAELRAIIDAVRAPERLGVCLDTCHVFAAGHDLRTAEGYEAMIARIEATIGIDRLALIHANDSRGAVGSRRDRHAAIGEGEIGAAGLARILRDPRLAALPVILETPKEGAGDEENLRRIRALRAGKSIRPRRSSKRRRNAGGGPVP
ncbi:MAG: deoxyribonuclease IV [Planctomycetes bacterium]|nr:deoxyribonuclease IV [Planctomycetota bacterium]